MRPLLFAAAMIGAMSVLAATDAMARAPMCPGASAGISARPGARTPIPLPDRALLAAPPEFDCDFKDAGRDDASGAGPPPAGAQADAALRRKLDHERQCYRHAEMILRSRLLRLQAPAGETIKAAAKCDAARGTSAWRGSGTTIPLPDQALLAAPPEFACEFKDAGRDDSSGRPQPGPPRAQADVSADLALRRKLEYERQCYRHAEMILRDRLLQLQASLGETITVINRAEQPAANQRPRGAVMQRPISRPRSAYSRSIWRPRSAYWRPIWRPRVAYWRPIWRPDVRSLRYNGSWRARAYFKRDCSSGYDSSGVRC
jgi:hypothetical protein